MIENIQYFNMLAKRKKDFLKLNLPYGVLETKNFPEWLKDIINVTYYKGLESINDRIKLYEDNHRLNNGYNSFLGVYYLSTKNNKIVVDAAIKPKRVWVASLYRLFEMIE